MLGRTLDVIVPEKHRERHWAGFHAAMESGVARSEGAAATLPMVCADGEIRRFAARFTLLRDPDGRAVGAAAVVMEPPSEASTSAGSPT